MVGEIRVVRMTGKQTAGGDSVSLVGYFSASFDEAYMMDADPPSPGSVGFGTCYAR